MLQVRKAINYMIIFSAELMLLTKDFLLDTVLKAVLMSHLLVDTEVSCPGQHSVKVGFPLCTTENTI